MGGLVYRAQVDSTALCCSVEWVILMNRRWLRRLQWAPVLEWWTWSTCCRPGWTYWTCWARCWVGDQGEWVIEWIGGVCVGFSELPPEGGGRIPCSRVNLIGRLQSDSWHDTDLIHFLDKKEINHLNNLKGQVTLQQLFSSDLWQKGVTISKLC